MQRCGHLHAWACSRLVPVQLESVAPPVDLYSQKILGMPPTVNTHEYPGGRIGLSRTWRNTGLSARLKQRFLR
jgi:hypothetical protein